jgi:hypothetical protein
MDEDIKEMLEEEVRVEILGLGSLEVGSKEHTAAINNLNTLYRLLIDGAKVDLDYLNQSDGYVMDTRKHQMDGEMREREINNELKHQRIRIAIEVAGIILPLMFYASWMKRGFKFEETGTYTSSTFRGLFSRFKPTKN